MQDNEHFIRLSTEDFERLLDMLERPPRSFPRLARLLSQEPRWAEDHPSRVTPDA